MFGLGTPRAPAVLPEAGTDAVGTTDPAMTSVAVTAVMPATPEAGLGIG